MENILPYFPPALVLLATLIIRSGILGTTRSMGVFAAAANAIGLIVSILLVGVVYSSGPVETTLFSFGQGDVFRFALRVDALTSIMLVLISGMSTVVHNYSIRYMEGDTRAGKYFAELTLTAFGILSFVLSANLLQMFLSWHIAGYGLHQLLTYFKDRPGAVAAAKDRWVVSRIGDVFLVLGMILVYVAYGSLDLNVIFARAGFESNPYFFSLHSWGVPLSLPALETIGTLFAVGALTKSAQVPFHSWLPKTMESPTTVSAFMHAGIINAGGFLIIRMSPIVAHSPVAMHLLFIFGTLTATFGGLVMLTQTDIKRKLAYSTIGQMGFMIMQCGLGAFTAALFHLVMHGLFKSYAFLSAGGAIAKGPAISSLKGEQFENQIIRASLSVALSALLVFAAMNLAGLSVEQKAGGFMLLFFYGITIAQMIFAALESKQVLRPLVVTLSFGLAALTGYLWVLHKVEGSLSVVLAESAYYTSNSPIETPFLVFTGAVFIFITLSHWLKVFPAAHSLSRRAYMLVNNHFYIDRLNPRDVFGKK